MNLSLPLPLQALSPRTRALLLSQIMALIWWTVAYALRGANVIPVWHDQSITFARAYDLAHPYAVSSFIYPPYAAGFFATFGLLPLPLATLIQLCLYFAIVTLIIFKFGGRFSTAALVVSSFLAFDSAIELNIEWIVYLGLLVPPLWSGIFLLVKPQDAFGYWLGLERRDQIRAAAVALAVVVLCFLVWGDWITPMWDGIQRNTLARAIYAFNMAPIALLGRPLGLLVCVPVGLFLAYRAFRRRDPVLGVWAGLFFVPYITFYSLMLPFALLAIRFPRMALILTVVTWVVYGSILARYFLHL